MVAFAPQFDPFGEIGKSVGGGFGQALGTVAEQEYNRSRILGGLNQIKDDIAKKRAAGESINPFDVQFGLLSALAPIPGGMQAIGSLSKPLFNEIQRMNQEAGGKENEMPSGSIIESKPGAVPPSGRGRFSTTQPSETAPTQIESPDQVYERFYQEELGITKDPETARTKALDRFSGWERDQGRKQKQQQFTNDIFQGKVKQSFEKGLSSPFENEFQEQFSYRVNNGEDPNKAFNDLLPKYRAAQVAEENLKESTGANRPFIFTGDLDQRMENAKKMLQPIAEIDPEYATSLAMKELDYGIGEASKIVMPGDEQYRRFISNIKEIPQKFVPTTEGGLPEYVLDEKEAQKVKNKTIKFFKNNWNPKKDSLLAFRAEMFDKGLPTQLFVEAVDEAFPNGTEDENLSVYNRNEYPKLSESIIPGKQEIFNSPLKALGKILNVGIRGRK